MMLLFQWGQIIPSLLAMRGNSFKSDAKAELGKHYPSACIPDSHDND